MSAFTSIPISAVLPAYVTSTLFIPSVSAVSSVGLNTKSFAVSSPYATSFVVLSDIVTVRTSPLGSNVSPALYVVLAGTFLTAILSTVGFSGSTGVSAFTSIPISAVLPAYVTVTFSSLVFSAVSRLGLNVKSAFVASP